MRHLRVVLLGALVVWGVPGFGAGAPEFFRAPCAPRVYSEATLTRTLRGLNALRAEYLSRGGYKAFHMSTHERDEDQRQGVTYLTEEQRRQHRVFFCLQTNGAVRLCDIEGKLIDTRVAQAFRTDRAYRALFVMDMAGHFYISSYQRDREFHHSSFFGDAPIAAAGEIEVIDGVVVFMGDRTGHFPYSDIFLQALIELERREVDLNGIEIGRWDGSSTYTYTKYVPLDRELN
ncbi:MAG: hypothetical protein KDD39_15765 [Bdellovibrionales bacterium]|nr:hypothetical protein [Bdellovibrionales bacterium]